MQISKIKPDHWYQTAKGIGKCIAVSKTSAKFEGLSDADWLTPKEVEYEIPEGEEPREEAETPTKILDVLKTVKEHIDELAEAWSRGALTDHDGQGATRSNRNADVQRMLEKVINQEKRRS